MSKADISKIEQVAMFDGLDDKELAAIVKAGTQLKLPADRSLMSDRTPADKAYLILDGEVSVRTSKHEEIATLGPGNIVGETAIVSHKLRNANVVTTTPVEMLHFTRESIERLCQEIPAFEKALRSASAGHAADAQD